MYAHVYFVDGLLIDTGQRGVRSILLEQIGQLPVRQMIVTHYHEDHSGNIDLLQRHFDCPVYASAECCEIMKAPPPISFAQRMTWGNRPAYAQLTTIQEQLVTDHHTFQVIPVPGHAQDMIVLYEPEQKWLFSADLYVHHYIGYMLPEESIAQQIQSIRRVLELDFDVLFCGHNPQFKGGKILLEKKLSFLERFFEDVAALYHRGYQAREIFSQLKFKENRITYWLSGGHLSRINMVRAVIRDLS